jgi:hypothetical protein
MPRFYFDQVSELSRETDLVGQDFSHEDGALADARERALALVKASRESGETAVVTSIVVRNQAGHVAGTIYLGDGRDGPPEAGSAEKLVDYP